MKKKEKYFHLIYIFSGLSLFFLLSVISRKSTAFSEWYATHIYNLIQGMFSRINGIIPVSLFEMSIIFEIFLLFYVIYRTVYNIIKKRFKAIIKIYIRLVSLIVTILLMFELNMGINYQRIPFSQYSDFSIEKEPKEKLIDLCAYLIEEANKLVSNIDTSDTYADGKFGPLFSLENTDERNEAKKAMEKLGQKYPVLNGYYPKPKPIIFSKIMSYEFITGITTFTIEATYNNDMLDFEKPFTMCHELSHMRGFMREDEAGFIAFLACMESDNINFRYSGILGALSYVLNSVNSNCGKTVYSSLYGSMDSQIVRDFTASYYYWEKYKTPVAKVADAVNNVYLQVNSQPEGVKSYGRMVDLLLAYYTKEML